MKLKDVLTQMAAMIPPPEGFRYGSLYGYFAEQGELMTFSPATAQERRAIKAEVRRLRPQMKQCFYNAQKLALENGLFVYCEGFVVSARVPIPIHHGWLLLRCGAGRQVLVDPTLRLNADKPLSPMNIAIGPPPEGWEYVGRAFSTAEVRRRWATGEAGSLVDWPPEWPLLRAAR